MLDQVSNTHDNQRSDERRSTSRALKAWQAIYWAQDELPGIEDIVPGDLAEDSAMFLITMDRNGDECGLLPADRPDDESKKHDLTDKVPAVLLPRVTDAIRLAHESRRPVSCNGETNSGENADALAYRSIFLPLRDAHDEQSVWLFGAFSYKTAEAA